MNLDFWGIYQPMDNETIIVSGASWRFVEPWISYQTLKDRLFSVKYTNLKNVQGDIFALQLRGHIAFA